MGWAWEIEGERLVEGSFLDGALKIFFFRISALADSKECLGEVKPQTSLSEDGEKVTHENGGGSKLFR